MGKITGFLEIGREAPQKRPVAERIHDFRELEGSFDESKLRAQASRCMDCGVPFCHKGCPLGNVIPDWNDLVYRERWRDALDRLHSTNNFPEVTGRVCPAPCEEACVLALAGAPVTIKQVEKQIVDRGFAEGWIAPMPALEHSGKSVAVVGSGPAGLACAQQLARAGHTVVVFERADRIGGLLRYGIPDFKLEKWQLDRRMAQMEEEGVVFRPGVDVGRDVDAAELRASYDAVVLAGGATLARELPVPGRELSGIHLAMDYLPQQNKRVAGDRVEGAIDAAGKKVVILGGGDTGSDCLGTALRQGAASVTQLELMPRPPDARPTDVWPAWPMILRTSTSQEEGGERDWSVVTKRFEGDAEGRVKRLHAVRAAWSKDQDGRPRMVELPDTDFAIDCDLVLLALGFLGPERGPLLEGLGVALDARGNVAVDAATYATNVPGVFACGDMRRGQSLVVWAIWEGREAARGVDGWLRAGARR